MKRYCKIYRSDSQKCILIEFIVVTKEEDKVMATANLMDSIRLSVEVEAWVNAGRVPSFAKVPEGNNKA